MNREPIFPGDWIAPGEFRFCGCGYTLLPKGTLICAKCKYRPKLEDHLCFCGKTAAMFFVHGFRCEEHTFQKEPSQATITDKMTFTYGRLKPLPPEEYERRKVEIAECERVHNELEVERTALAVRRQQEGVKPLFWLEKSD